MLYIVLYIAVLVNIKADNKTDNLNQSNQRCTAEVVAPLSLSPSFLLGEIVCSVHIIQVAHVEFFGICKRMQTAHKSCSNVQLQLMLKLKLKLMLMLKDAAACESLCSKRKSICALMFRSRAQLLTAIVAESAFNRPGPAWRAQTNSFMTSRIRRVYYSQAIKLCSTINGKGRATDMQLIKVQQQQQQQQQPAAAPCSCSQVGAALKRNH